MMRLKLALATCAVIVFPASVYAQALERVDPQTGNYVSVPDVGAANYPDAKLPNPNRLGNRLSLHNYPTAIPPHGAASSSSDDAVTPAQQMARNSAYNGQAADITSPTGTPEQTDQNGFVSMSGMAMYTPPGSQSFQDGSFAMPDWWPK